MSWVTFQKSYRVITTSKTMPVRLIPAKIRTISNRAVNEGLEWTRKIVTVRQGFVEDGSRCQLSSRSVEGPPQIDHDDAYDCTRTNFNRAVDTPRTKEVGAT